MTEQLSRKQVEWLRDAATEFASTQMKMTMKPEEVLQLTTALLAGMDSKPVAKVETVGVCWYADNGVPRKPAVGAALYAAAPAPVVPGELHPDTQKLVADFCAALAEKLYKAQLKYGYDADWKQDGWPSQCQAHFHQHIAKGDPRDVAAYCAFMWYHGWKTEAAKPAPVAVTKKSNTDYLDTLALDTAREIMCDVNRRADFLGGDIQLLSHIQCRIDEAFRAAMLKAEPVMPAAVADQTAAKEKLLELLQRGIDFQSADIPVNATSAPMQPLEFDDRGTLRFKENKIVRRLLDYSKQRGYGLNEIALEDFTDDDRMQLAQLIGYSLSGYGELSYVSDESWERAAAATPEKEE